MARFGIDVECIFGYGSITVAFKGSKGILKEWSHKMQEHLDPWTEINEYKFLQV